MASFTTRSRTSSGVLGRPTFFAGFLFAPFPLLTQPTNVRGVTIMINSLIVEPSFLPAFTSFRRSSGVTVIRFGSLLRRISFSRFSNTGPDGPVPAAWRRPARAAEGEICATLRYGENTVFLGMTEFLYPARDSASPVTRTFLRRPWRLAERSRIRLCELRKFTIANALIRERRQAATSTARRDPRATNPNRTSEQATGKKPSRTHSLSAACPSIQATVW